MKRVLLIFSLCLVFFSCSKWEYIKDYEYSAVYFAHQNQLRTLVAQDPMSFEFGVYLAGRRKNTKNEWVKYAIEPTLLTNEAYVGTKTFELLPEECYTLSSPDVFNIPVGSLLGVSKLTLDVKKFTSLPNSTSAAYALPVKILEASVDTVLIGEYSPEGSLITAPKDYAVIVIKYINPYHGNYYLKGVRYKLQGEDYVKDQEYFNKDLSRNKVVKVMTDDLYSSIVNVVGGIESTDSNKLGLALHVDADKKVTVNISGQSASILSFNDLGSTYDSSERTFTLVYEYVTTQGTFKVEESLIWRDTELRFETW